MTIRERVQKAYDRKMDQFNETVARFRDEVQLLAADCEELVERLNSPSLTSRPAELLRHLLCLSIDIIRIEDGLVTLIERGVE